MDALTYIIAFMVAIVAGWVGYFLGNFFPVFGKAKRIKDANKAAGRPMADISPLRQTTRRMMDWLLEREDDGEDDAPEARQVSGEHHESFEDALAGAQKAAAMPVALEAELVGVPEMLDDDALVVWHDRRKKKIMARIKDHLVDLDSDLTPSQHGALSMLLVDLQERVGLSATLRDAIAKETDKVFTEKKRKGSLDAVKKEEELKPPSFNPLKSFVNYVQADAPRIEQKPDSIPAQVNVILQEMIEGTPLAEKGVSMAEWPNRGTVFIVGIEVYDEIHKIPDPEIRMAIRNAVKQWEASQETE